MSSLGFVAANPQTITTPQSTGAAIQIVMDDVLASSHRLWLRGGVRGLSPAPTGVPSRWWNLRTQKPQQLPAISRVHLVTKIGGSVVEAELPLDEYGRFEAILDVALTSSRRGWRVARSHFTLDGRDFDVCSLVLSPMVEAACAVAVLLPPSATQDAASLQSLASSPYSSELLRQLREWDLPAKGRLQIYYLACVPVAEEYRTAEYALAATALGWPPGTFVLLPSPGQEAGQALTGGLERLRRVFEGSLELRVFDGQSSSVAPLPKSAGRLRETARPARARMVPRHPVVFCHGMLAFSLVKMSIPEDCNSFSPMRNLMEERGFRTLFPQVAPTSGVAARAAQLKEQILSWTDEPVNIVAHSMGGLDARHLITHLDMAGKVKSLTTVSTPHRGTHLADWALDNFHKRVPLLLALESFGVNIDGFRDCRPVTCAAFNAATPDRPDVAYFSYGASVPLWRLSPVLRRAWNILKPVEGDNDGMVSVSSARWGQYLGTIAADHFAQTPDFAFVRPGEDFDVVGFYARLVEDLARRGF